MPLNKAISLLTINSLLLVTSGAELRGEDLPARISVVTDNGVEAAANDALRALHSFRISPNYDSLADLHRAGRGLKSQLNRHYSYFGPKESQSFEKSLIPLLDAMTDALKAYQYSSSSRLQIDLTLKAVTQCRFFVSPEPRSR